MGSDTPAQGSNRLRFFNSAIVMLAPFGEREVKFSRAGSPYKNINSSAIFFNVKESSLNVRMVEVLVDETPARA